jgi:transcriptional regulator with XRE-family HTH domain
MVARASQGGIVKYATMYRNLDTVRCAVQEGPVSAVVISVERRSVAVSRAAADALRVLGNQIKLARIERGWSLADTADRLGVDRRTVSSIEAGSSKVAIGTVFNAAVLVGVDLFGLSGPELARARRQGEETLVLMPERVRQPSRKDSDDDFAF